MKLLLDQGLPRSAANLLQNVGVDAIHTGDIDYTTAEDAAIIEWARQEGRIVVTLDADFHALLALSQASLPSVIRIRIEGLRAKAVAELVQIILKDWGDELEAGAALTVLPGHIRFRHLPLLVEKR